MGWLRVVVVVLVCSAAFGPAVTAHAGHGGDTDEGDGLTDPETDRIGWEAGYWHDEPIAVNQSEGLNGSEREALVGRAMARVEYIRNGEFTRPVPVSTANRSAYGSVSGNTSDEFKAWNNQVWEALFVSGEDSNVQEQLDATYSGAVLGFYDLDEEEIRIISPEGEPPRIDEGTLVHELVHAHQDQRGVLSVRANATTQDRQLAVGALVEGEANYVEQEYADRCGEEWSCVDRPVVEGGSGGSGSADVNLALLAALLQPYSDGPVYVDHLIERGGWTAVDRAFETPPTSTEQVIHLTDEAPSEIRYVDRSESGWRTYPEQGENGSDTVGEASMFVLFWNQARTAGAETVDPESFRNTTDDRTIYNYEATPSAGWGNDRLVPYRPTEGNGTEGGYVWVTTWDTKRDATEFVDAYKAVLRARNATRREGLWVIPDGPFADAFRFNRNDTSVTVVNGPTPEAVREIRPPRSGTGGRSTPTAGSAPGFGSAAALLGLCLAVAGGALVRRRRRGRE